MNVRDQYYLVQENKQKAQLCQVLLPKFSSFLTYPVKPLRKNKCNKGHLQLQELPFASFQSMMLSNPIHSEKVHHWMTMIHIL